MNKYVTIVFPYMIFFAVSCNNNRAKEQLKHYITQNMDRQVLINKKQIEDWKRMTFHKAYVQHSDSALTELRELRLPILAGRPLTVSDFGLEEKIKFLQHKRIRTWPEDTLSLPKNKELSLAQKIRAYTQLFRLTKILTYISESHCYYYFAVQYRYFPLPQNTDEKRTLITFFTPVELQKGSVIFYQKGGKKTEVQIPQGMTETPWNIAIPKSEQPVAIAWADSNSLNGITRRFTWPNYIEY